EATIFRPHARSRHARRRAGVSLIDAMVLVVIAVLLLQAVVMVRAQADDKAQRVACADNLRQIGRAMQAYAEANRGLYPCTTWDQDHVEQVNLFSNWRAADPFAKDGVK